MATRARATRCPACAPRPDRRRGRVERSIVATGLARPGSGTYGGATPVQDNRDMASSPRRYRITVTPVEAGGLPCAGRCAIEFEQPCADDWMRVVESNQRIPGLSADERTALVIGARLLDGIARRHPASAGDPLVGLRAPLGALLARLEPGGDN